MSTPIRQQYLNIKRRHADAIVLFRLGDFYETFDEDARLASRELDIVLTTKNMGKNTKVPLAGIPAHALEPYLTRLIKKGHKVAICEQLSDPATSKGLVERDVVRVVTPGTVLEPSLLENKCNNYLVAVVIEGDHAGVAYADITTGEFSTTQLPITALTLELDRLSPAEVLVPQGQGLPDRTGEYTVSDVPSADFDQENSRQILLDHFEVITLESFGCDDLPMAVGAAGALVEYIARTQRGSLSHLNSLNTYSIGHYMILDRQTRRNLELFEGGRWGGSGPSVFSTIDMTRTPMGGRLLRRWVGQPLLDMEELDQRLDAVAAFHGNLLMRELTLELLSKITDLERVLNRIRLSVVVPRELLTLRVSLESAARLLDLLRGDAGRDVWWSLKEMGPCQDVVALIDAAIASEPAGDPGDGNVIREGFSPELDRLRQASRDARGYIANLERKERENTGIKTLKVGYNKVFGYYIEVSNPNLSQVPDDYARRQTLVGGERFITPKLKEYESMILNARERIEELERALYRQVCGQIGENAQAIGSLAEGVGRVDALAALAEVAYHHNYVRPLLKRGGGIEVLGGRHPVVERMLPPGTFVPNDTQLTTRDTQLVVLTGPNMAGKSTYIRQVAIIVLMAQIGSFVPAQSATIGLTDRIFTRVGLQDDLTTGQSTFMVEMVETASILNQATPRSLVILDEIGRGTSTYDGLSIARSVVEYLHNDPSLGCMTLFATHYHELTQLAMTLPRVRNYTVAVSEEDGQVVFLHRIVPGGADKSYGIHVAQLAGLPRSVIIRAWELLRALEAPQSNGQDRTNPSGARISAQQQMPLFSEPHLLLEELSRIDVSNMTPLEAINKLYALQQRAKSQNQSSSSREESLPS